MKKRSESFGFQHDQKCVTVAFRSADMINRISSLQIWTTKAQFKRLHKPQTRRMYLYKYMCNVLDALRLRA